MNLSELGWNSFFSRQFDRLNGEGLSPGRVAQEHRNNYLILCEHGELKAELSGKMHHNAVSRSDFPAVGDWVAVSVRPDEGRATIHAVLPRKSSFSRKAVLAGGPKYGDGKTEEQVLAANVDMVFLVSGLDTEFNIRRIERYIAVAWDSGTTPVVVLNKADLCTDIEGCIEEVESVAFGIPIHPVSATRNQRLDVLREYLTSGHTVAFLGSSGVGKSTLINSLLGTERQKVSAVREYDGKGRHTTTSREMILLPGGGIVIDTPGLREIQMWGDEEGLKKTFEDIEEYAGRCRFRDCRHEREPGCAIHQAIEKGVLDAGRFRSYVKMQKELRHLAIRKDQRARRTERDKWKKITVAHRKRLKKR